MSISAIISDIVLSLLLPDEAESIKYRPEYAITIAEGVTPVILGGRLLNVL